MSPNANGEPLRFAPGNHVGNQRFLVLLSLFRQRYLQADLFGHEYDCISIAQEVLETVCHKYPMAGSLKKFMITDGSNLGLLF